MWSHQEAITTPKTKEIGKEILTETQWELEKI